MDDRTYRRHRNDFWRAKERSLEINKILPPGRFDRVPLVQLLGREGTGIWL